MPGMFRLVLSVFIGGPLLAAVAGFRLLFAAGRGRWRTRLRAAFLTPLLPWDRLHGGNVARFRGENHE